METSRWRLENLYLERSAVRVAGRPGVYWETGDMEMLKQRKEIIGTVRLSEWHHYVSPRPVVPVPQTILETGVRPLVHIAGAGVVSSTAQSQALTIRAASTSLYATNQFRHYIPNHYRCNC